MFDRIYHYKKPSENDYFDTATSLARSLIQAIAHDLQHFADKLCEEHDMQYFLWG